MEPQSANQPTLFTIYKKSSEEKALWSERLKEIRAFNGDWNDIEDILEYDYNYGQWSQTTMPAEICKIMAKGKDWSWRWIPAECVSQSLITEFLKERVDSELSGQPTPAAAQIRNSSPVIWAVKRALRTRICFKEEIVVIERFLDLEEAKKCAEKRFEALPTNETLRTWKRYRFNNRFYGTVTDKADFSWWEGEESTVMVWVEKETGEYFELGQLKEGVALKKFLSVVSKGSPCKTKLYSGLPSSSGSYVEEAEEEIEEAGP